ncbi:porin family protein [Paraferrimonas sp. SM1919]|uniref:porin family protein n=1 Tax=Paraferrimonas sp. SM1919 TaxID=2662263 RepID=UPI0013D8A9B2|nr:porin family protein [Paraferrimonas sp. SM1919]
MKKYLILLAALTTLSTHVMAKTDKVKATEVENKGAEGGFYIGAMLTTATIEFKASSKLYREGDPTVLTGVVGYEFNKYFAVEGRYGGSVSDGDVPEDSEGWWITYYPAKMKVDNVKGVYAKLSWPINEKITPYAIVGRTSGELSFTYPGYNNHVTEKEPESSTSYGAGVNLNVNKHLRLGVEYTKYFNIEELRASGLSFVASIKF